jgi:L-alanine-DL-glutamate epimerase-like enolase superfamily enzyme
MKLNWKPFTLEFKHPFRIAHGVRSTTPVMFTRIDQEGFSGYGEASMPPYLGESHESADTFFRKLNLQQFKDPFDIRSIMEYVDKQANGNTAAKAAVDIALHDLAGKMLCKTVHSIYQADPSRTPCTSFTIGMDSPALLRMKIRETGEFPVLKVKLGGADDRLTIETVHAETDKVFSVDVNQGWTDKEYALDMIYRMKEMNVSFVEQPFGRYNLEDHAWLKERSPLPLIADESCQRFTDIEECRHAFHGINIKLMKCTGLSEAKRMIDEAGKYKLKILIGCMSESSCAVSAAAQLSPFAEWADLDGPLLIKNDIFDGITFLAGKITLSELPGNGAVLKEVLFD